VSSHGTIARIEFGGYRGDTRLLGPDEPSWIGANDGSVSPFHRMLWTVDDCCSTAGRAGRSPSGRPSTGFPAPGSRMRMSRLRPLTDWRFEPDTGRVLRATANGGWRPASGRELVLIPGPA
jgi:hypothetical protein